VESSFVRSIVSLKAKRSGWYQSKLRLIKGGWVTGVEGGANQKHSPQFQTWQDEDLAWGGGFDDDLTVRMPDGYGAFEVVENVGVGGCVWIGGRQRF
jgi:hypothetical protein